MKARRGQRTAIVIAHAVVGWALCFATIGIGMRVTTVQAALVVHAIGAPLYFCAISFFYYRHFAFTTPLQTAFLFTGIVMSLDFFLVALVILKNLDMFASLLGTWIPFALIFVSTWATGLLVKGRSRRLMRPA